MTTATPCTGCAVQQGTHQPAEALHQIAEPAASVEKQIEEVMRKVEFMRGAAQFGSPSELDAARKGVEEKLRTLLSTPQPCSRSHPHEEMTPMCELRTEIARLTNALARAEAQLAAAPQAVQPRLPVPMLPAKQALHVFYEGKERHEVHGYDEQDMFAYVESDREQHRAASTHPTQQGLEAS